MMGRFETASLFKSTCHEELSNLSLIKPIRRIESIYVRALMMAMAVFKNHLSFTVGCTSSDSGGAGSGGGSGGGGGSGIGGGSGNGWGVRMVGSVFTYLPEANQTSWPDSRRTDSSAESL
jgi:hypothetical protein